MSVKITAVNDIGLRIEGEISDRLAELMFYAESGAVLLSCTVRGEERSIDGMQYLTPIDAMKLSKALDRCAVQALRNQS